MNIVDSEPVLKPSEYTVGWITTLSTEFGAARRMFDKRHKTPKVRGDRFQYATGTILEHNVVIACSGEAGVGRASYCASQMMRSFPNIKIAFLSGVGGGVPSEKNDIRVRRIFSSKMALGSCSAQLVAVLLSISLFLHLVFC
jgi:nucleoside phosphorylase